MHKISWMFLHASEMMIISNERSDLSSIEKVMGDKKLLVV
jgi:hypothetical protein